MRRAGVSPERAILNRGDHPSAATRIRSKRPASHAYAAMPISPCAATNHSAPANEPVCATK
ncbi:hypothetical protein UA11_04124 [Burkholderia multivorans]|jgi:hypothetical protein|nr:hypothetical protein UA12_03951 [Burkholderia multivorans]SAJ89472.1 hypothetical protein UA11_04124 [Burkholderia multivorans]